MNVLGRLNGGICVSPSDAPESDFGRNLFQVPKMAAEEIPPAVVPMDWLEQNVNANAVLLWVATVVEFGQSTRIPQIIRWIMQFRRPKSAFSSLKSRVIWIGIWLCWAPIGSAGGALQFGYLVQSDQVKRSDANRR